MPVHAVMSVGLAILVFAIINYINLTVAQTGFRAKEMAIRRLLGSSRVELFIRLADVFRTHYLLVTGIVLILISGAKPVEVVKGSLRQKTNLNYVAIAFVLVMPLIWYIMQKWLSAYAWRISLSPWFFIIAGMFCLLISFLGLLAKFASGQWKPGGRNQSGIRKDGLRQTSLLKTIEKQSRIKTNFATHH